MGIEQQAVDEMPPAADVRRALETVLASETFRGSAKLLSRSVRCFVPAVEAIVNAAPEVWDIDADGYTPEAIETILSTSSALGSALPGGQSHTLVTKTMLGVFGCVPAFDTYFKRGFGVWAFGRNALMGISAYYKDNADIIERNRVRTWDFNTAEQTKRRYTRAKIIDMIFFIEGTRRS